ncbi:unnamed protein product [Prorocentrum cordatum]|uniref:tRNA (adenine(58)-N(1))-methyltransferase n=1 Tax=Prorocentrum cordatum TaxID=2364126 RepID=A0ABN9U2K2_9DINO|nr:unnamed protein product [Polarella glacialis]
MSERGASAAGPAGGTGSPAAPEAAGGAATAALAAASPAPARDAAAGSRPPSAPGAGDYIVLWGGYSSVSGAVLEHGAITNNRYGSFHHDDLIGQPYGSKVWSRKGRAWLAMLRPSPEMLTQSLTHRTQIIYHADISLLLMLLDVRPGKVVVEAGTGSGSVSASLARALCPGGTLYTFEFHEERQRQAAADFERYGLSGTIVSQHRDVCKNGFTDALDGMVDGLFLDLPAPWSALAHADRCLKDGGKVCTFSPCIEQIEKTAEEMRRGDRYCGIRMFESLAVNWGVREVQAKRRRTAAEPQEAQALGEACQGGPAEAAEGAAAPLGKRPAPDERDAPSLLSYPMPMRSHTSYLMVATKAARRPAGG